MTADSGSIPAVHELAKRLLLVAFRHVIHEADLESGRLRFQALVGADVDQEAFSVALADALRAGFIDDPVQLSPGALQCSWHLRLTSKGVNAALALRQGVAPLPTKC